MINRHAHRKNEHVSLAEYFNRQDYTDDFKNVRFVHQSLPECSYAEIDPKTTVGPLRLRWPFYIEAMTGGSRQTQKINQKLGNVASKTHLAIASGSQRIALDDPKFTPTFTAIRHADPNGLVFANVGATSSVLDAQRAVQMLHANALEVHVNVPQELIMPEGHRSFYWISNIKKITHKVKVPVIVKEVGFGMAHETLDQLVRAGVKYVNVSGRGGTNFARIENFRRHDLDLSYLDHWGQTTTESLMEARAFEPHLTIIASGGVKNALDVAKALALGSKAVGVAGAFLHLVLRLGESGTVRKIQNWQRGLKIIMTMLGCRNVRQLRHQRLLLSPKLVNYIKQRQINYGNLKFR